MNGLLAAVAFLTRLPMPQAAQVSPVELPKVCGWFGLVGWMVGLVMALSAEVGIVLFGPWVGAALAVGAGVLLTGALHEDAVADTADAFFATKDRDKALGIMKDSRIGAYGGVALVLVLLLKVAAIAELSHTSPQGLLAGTLAASAALSRAWSVWLMGALNPIQSAVSLGRVYGTTVTPVQSGVALLTATALGGLGLALYAGTIGPVLLAGAGGFAVAMVLRTFFHRRLGGYTGDCLGAATVLCELAGLLAVLGAYQFFGL